MKTPKTVVILLAIAASFALKAEWKTLTWIGGAAGAANDASKWDPSNAGTPYDQNHTSFFLITNSVTFTVASDSGEYWRNVQLTVTNDSVVTFGARFWPTRLDSYLIDGSTTVIDVADGSTFTSSYMIGGGRPNTTILVKKGGGLLNAQGIGVSGAFKKARFLGGTTKLTMFYVTNEVEIAEGATVIFKNANGVDLAANRAVFTVDGVLDFNKHPSTIDGLRGQGVVANGLAGITLSLRAQGQETFSGLFNGVLNVVPDEDASSDSCLVIGDAYSLTNADLNVTSTARIPHPVKFAPGIGTFYAKKFPEDRTFYDTEGNVVKLERWAKHLYVDASSEASGDGLSEETAFKTLKEAVLSTSIPAAPELAIIHVAPGVYDSGEMGEEDNLSRVIVPGNVWLVADKGPQQTVICGRASPEPAPGNTLGCGLGAVRCVYLMPGARIKGFTLTGGHTYAEDAATSRAGRTGGGVYCGDKSGIIIDCVISNNAAVRGGGGVCGTYVRTRFFGNRANLGGALYLGCDLHSCILDDNTGTGFYHAGNKSYIRNSIFGPNGGSVRSDGDTATEWCEVFNTIFMSDTVGHNDIANRLVLNNCIVMTTGATSSSNADLLDGTIVTNNFKTAESKFAWLKLGADYAPLVPLDGPTVDRGKNAYYVDPYAAAGKFDISGFSRFSGSSIDLGPYEADSSRKFVTFEDDQGAVSVTGLSKGVNEIPVDGNLTVTLKRTFDSDKLCTGFFVDKTYYDFDDYPLGWSTNVVYGELSNSFDILAVYATNTVLWVDAAAGSETNKGYHVSCPKKTLSDALDDPALGQGGIVYVAPGTYDQGEMLSQNESQGPQRCRAIVPAGVVLESTEGADVTFIVGESSDDSPAPDCFGCGMNAMRCVGLLATNSVLRGFTCKGGRTICVARTSGHTGGGVRGPGIVEDCVFTNCVAVRGGGVHGAVCRRSFFVDCGATYIGSAVNESKGVYDCLFKACTNGAYITLYTIPVVNSTFLPVPGVNLIESHFSDTTKGPSNVVNCAIFTNTKMAPVYANCAFASCYNITEDLKGEGSFILPVSAATAVLDAAGMNADGTLKKGSALIDAGTNILYGAGLPGRVDFAHGQRVYNRTVDIGAYEFDYRRAFARSFGRRGGFAVVEASENVTCDSAGGVKLVDADTLAVLWPDARGLSRTYAFTVEVAGSGTLLCTASGGEPVEVREADGVKTFEIKGVEGAFDVNFAFAGEGAAFVREFKRDNNGTVLIQK